MQQHGQRKTITIAIEGYRLEVVYFPERLRIVSPARFQALRQLAETDPSQFYHHVHAMLLEILDSWNLLLEKGGPVVPLTLAGLAEVPTIILVAIWKQFNEVRRQEESEQSDGKRLRTPIGADGRSPAQREDDDCQRDGNARLGPGES